MMVFSISVFRMVVWSLLSWMQTVVFLWLPPICEVRILDVLF